MLENTPNRLYFGDNLPLMREQIAAESVDLIYLDPPFNSNATYNLLFREVSGEQSAAQITAFRDTWHWSIEAEAAYREVVQDGPPRLSRLLASMRDLLGQNNMMAYLTMMSQRMIELHRVLKPDGSIYLHCDPRASHYLKLLMETMFGVANFRNEIIWRRTYAHNDPKRFGRITDCILFYTKSGDYTWNLPYTAYSADYVERYFRYEDGGGRFQVITLTGPGVSAGESGGVWRDINPTDSNRHWSVPRRVIERLAGPDLESLSINEQLDLLEDNGYIYWPPGGSVPRFKEYLHEMEGSPVQNLWTDIRPLGSRAKERMGYPTQKPEALLERILQVSSNPGDLVLDPFCGCGTTVAVAERLSRRWIGIDITHLAVSLMKSRLQDSFGDNLRPYDLIGVPRDVASARALAIESEHDGRYQFEWWALGLVAARPAQERRKGADAGIDGYINFFDDNSGRPKRIVVQVKSGQVNRGQIATLKSDMARERAQIALFITLNPPTGPMLREAAAAGFYEPAHFPGQQFPRVQILTIEELLNGQLADYPRYAPEATFRRAARRRRAAGQQGGF